MSSATACLQSLPLGQVHESDQVMTRRPAQMKRIEVSYGDDRVPCTCPERASGPSRTSVTTPERSA